MVTVVMMEEMSLDDWMRKLRIMIRMRLMDDAGRLF